MELSTVERNSAACALEWSIELEKALRSKKPGRAIEAIQQIGSRLEQWSREPESTDAVYNMFDLVASEDRLFANTILLRLSDAFKVGNKNTRLSIVRIFFSELRRREKMERKLYKRILSKGRVQNHQELLNRVKFVFDSGDPESKGLAMFLFGCWADFAKDSAQIRYLILSSMVSPHSLEIKASLCAAACFSELADDFARVVLEMLVNIMTSSGKASVRLAGARVFAKLGCSYSVAREAYKTGLQVLSEASEEDILIAMLVSLSTLASKSILFVSEQVDLLCSFLSHEKPRVQEISFRCLHFLFMKGVFRYKDTLSLVRMAVNVLDKAVFPTVVQCQALKILHKILLYSVSNQTLMETLDFSKLLTVLEDSFKSSSFPKRLLAIHILTDISLKIRGGTEKGSDGSIFHFLPLHVITLIMDQSALLVKQLSDQSHTTPELFQEVQSLLYHLILVIENLDLDVTVVERMCLSTTCFVMIEGNKNKEVSLRLALIIYRYVGICLEYLNKAVALSFGLLEKVNHLVEFICRSDLFNCYTNKMYSLLLHSQLIFSCMVNERKEICGFDGNPRIKLCKYVIKHEILSIAYARKILIEGDNWQAYIAGTCATNTGGWFLAYFIFGNLVTKVSSNSFRFWLKSLDKFALSELKIHSLRLKENEYGLVDCSDEELPVMLSDEKLHQANQLTAEKSIMFGYSEKLFEAYQELRSACKMLETAVTSDQTFCFQRWFLSLRAKTVAMLGNICKVLGEISHLQSGANEEDKILKSLREFTKLSSSLNKLAQEFDLILTSFVGINSKSSKIISELGLRCSLLAFCTGFAQFVPELSKSIETTDKENLSSFSLTLIQNLAGRLWPMDDEMAKNFSHLLAAIGGPKKCLHPTYSRNQILDFKCEAREILKLCSDGVVGIVCLRNEENGFHDSTTLEHVTKKGAQYLSNILMNWMHIPFRNPKHFFRVRPCVRSELFIVEQRTRKTDQISISPGCHLSLSICLQLKYVPKDPKFQLRKLYCILFCNSKSVGGDNMQKPVLQAWEDDDIIEMNEKLLNYVTELRSENSVFEADCKSGLAQAMMEIEPNDKGQGFSSCLLDVSRFPIGCYRIKWFSCCVDSRGYYWSLLPFNVGPVFTIQHPLY